GVKHDCLSRLDISWIDLFQERLIRTSELTRLKPVNPMEFIRPGHHVVGNVPLEATDVRHALSLRQSCFVTRQALLSRALLRHVEGNAQATGYSSVIVSEWFQKYCIPTISQLVLERLPLPGQRREMIRNRSIGRIFDTEKFEQRHADLRTSL